MTGSESTVSDKKKAFYAKSIYELTYVSVFFASWFGLSVLLYDPLCEKLGSNAAGGLVVIVLPLVSLLIGGLAKFLVHHYYVRKKFGPVATELFYGHGSSKYLDKE
jgi:membrane protein YdbS with pleckstrin-like domain